MSEWVWGSKIQGPCTHDLDPMSNILQFKPNTKPAVDLGEDCEVLYPGLGNTLDASRALVLTGLIRVVEDLRGDKPAQDLAQQQLDDWIATHMPPEEPPPLRSA